MLRFACVLCYDYGDQVEGGRIRKGEDAYPEQYFRKIDGDFLRGDHTDHVVGHLHVQLES